MYIVFAVFYAIEIYFAYADVYELSKPLAYTHSKRATYWQYTNDFLPYVIRDIPREIPRNFTRNRFHVYIISIIQLVYLIFWIVV